MIGSIPLDQVFTLLFLMLGPFKIVGPFAKLTQDADARLTRRLAFASIAIATVALLLAALIGEGFLAKYRIGLPVLLLAAGIILFLVALRSILQQFDPPSPPDAPARTPGMNLAMSPLAFPTIVTPHGIAILIVFIAVAQDQAAKMQVVQILLAIMAINLVAMLLARYILKFLGVALQILGAVLGVIQVALGLNIMITSLKLILAKG